MSGNNKVANNNNDNSKRNNNSIIVMIMMKAVMMITIVTIILAMVTTVRKIIRMITTDNVNNKSIDKRYNRNIGSSYNNRIEFRNISQAGADMFPGRGAAAEWGDAASSRVLCRKPGGEKEPQEPNRTRGKWRLMECSQMRLASYSGAVVMGSVIGDGGSCEAFSGLIVRGRRRLRRGEEGAKPPGQKVSMKGPE